MGEARVRRACRMPRHEAIVRAISAAVFLVVAGVLASVLPSERAADPVLALGLVGGYALVSRVRFEFGDIYVVPEQLVFVAMLALAPLPLVPLMVAAGAVLGVMPDFLRGLWHGDRADHDDWRLLVRSRSRSRARGPGARARRRSPLAEVYVLAYLAQFTCDLVWDLLRNRLTDQPPDRGRSSAPAASVARIDAILSPIAFLVSVAADPEPIALVALGPLVWLLEIFSRDRRERYAAALELNRAYRGTVMVLSDILEFDDEYTAHHSRSVLELVDAVADEMGIAEAGSPGTRVRSHASRRRKNLHPQGDPAQAFGADSKRVRGHQEPHDRGTVHSRSRRRRAWEGRRDSPLVSRTLGRSADIQTVSKAMPSPWLRGSSLRATPTTP